MNCQTPVILSTTAAALGRQTSQALSRATI